MVVEGEVVVTVVGVVCMYITTPYMFYLLPFLPSLLPLSPSLPLSLPPSHLVFILFFPVLFALGWLPQPDTFAIYFMEQIDMHIFGGTSSTGLLCSLYAITRNILVGVVLWPLGYAAFSNLEVCNYVQVFGI